MKTAIYPGTFDPITLGHIDVIKKSLNIFDKVIVATTDNINKNYHFSIDERLDIINNSLFKDLKLNKKKIKVISFNNLTIDLCKKYVCKLDRKTKAVLVLPHFHQQIYNHYLVKVLAIYLLIPLNLPSSR